VPYERSEKWLGFFASMADGIKLRVDPGSALDVGGAHRLLVKALRDRGIDADGFDVSDRSTPSRPR